MKGVDLNARVRRAVYVEGMSQRGAARYFGIDPRTVAKRMRFSVPPGYRRSRPPARPKLDRFTGIIDQILDDDGSIAAKQRHTAKRIFERLRDEHGYGGGYTTVKDYVRVRRQQRREVFVPLWHPAGHGQADFGEAVAVIGGVAQKVHLFVMDLPQSDAGFVKAYPGETTEAFLDGHVSAFAFFGGVPRSILYDNTKLAVARVLGDGKRQRTRASCYRMTSGGSEHRRGRRSGRSIAADGPPAHASRAKTRKTKRPDRLAAHPSSSSLQLRDWSKSAKQHPRNLRLFSTELGSGADVRRPASPCRLRRALPRTGRIADGMKLTIIKSVEAGIQAELRHIECAVAAGSRGRTRAQGRATPAGAAPGSASGLPTAGAASAEIDIGLDRAGLRRQ